MRLFVSIEIPKQIRTKLADLQKELSSDSIRFVDPKIIHLTVKFIGEIPDEKGIRISEIVHGLKFEPFNIKLIGVGTFSSEKHARVLWIGGKSIEFADLSEKLNRKLKKSGIKESEFGSNIHVTLGRIKKEINLEDFLSKHKDEVFGEFMVNKLKLKKVTLTPLGPVYQDL